MKTKAVISFSYISTHLFFPLHIAPANDCLIYVLPPQTAISSAGQISSPTGHNLNFSLFSFSLFSQIVSLFPKPALHLPQPIGSFCLQLVDKKVCLLFFSLPLTNPTIHLLHFFSCLLSFCTGIYCLKLDYQLIIIL